MTNRSSSRFFSLSLSRRTREFRRRFVRVVAVAALAAGGLMGARRSETGCSPRARVVEFVNGTAIDTHRLQSAHTDDVEVRGAARPAMRLRYGGDSSSRLYVWADGQSLNNHLLGHRYFGITHFSGTGPGDPRISFTASDVGIPGGVVIGRNYDRGECSAFVRWPEFRDQLKNNFDTTLPGLELDTPSGRVRVEGPLGNSIFTPLLRVQPGTVYSTDTPDTFRFTRQYQVRQVGFPYLTGWMVGTIEGRFIASTLAGQAVQFDLQLATARPHDSATPQPLPAVVRNAIVAQLEAAANDQLFQTFLLPGTSTALNCTASDPLANEDCRLRIEGLLQVPLGRNYRLDQRMARCRARANLPAACQLGVRVYRAQEYPEGFELVISDRVGDQSWQLLSLPPRPGEPSSFDTLCNPLRFPETPSSGAISALFAP